MNITSITYTRLQTLEGYHNERIGATATVEAHDDPDVVLNELKAWVEERMQGSRTASEIKQSIESLQYTHQNLIRDFREMTERWERAKAFLAHHGLDIAPQDIPF
jgi:hypothetical protein